MPDLRVNTTSQLKGKITLPPSKSHTMRAILFAALAKGESLIDDSLLSPDAYRMLDAVKGFGAKVHRKKGRLYITGVEGRVQTPEDIIDCGNSGQVLRFVAGVLALQDRYAVLTGDISIRSLRPMAPLLSGLRQMGANCFCLKDDEKAPVIINGPVKAGHIKITGEDSQPVSALLITATQVEGVTTVEVENPGEIPWVNLTLDWFDRLGLSYTKVRDGLYEVPGKQVIQAFQYQVPGDLSSLAYPVVAALITRSIVQIDQVDLSDSQGDKKALDLLEDMGARFDYQADLKRLTVKKTERLLGQTLDVNACIDAVTILAVCACFATTPTTIVNAAIAREKESDRLKVIAAALNQMGGDVKETEDGLIINPKPLVGTTFDSHEDHRIAMSVAVAALGAKGITTITNAKCIEKSFPKFCQTMQSLKANLAFVEDGRVMV